MQLGALVGQKPLAHFTAGDSQIDDVQAAPNATSHRATARPALAGRPVSRAPAFRDTFTRKATKSRVWLTNPGARRSGSAWGIRKPDRHFATTPVTRGDK